MNCRVPGGEVVSVSTVGKGIAVASSVVLNNQVGPTTKEWSVSGT